MSEKIAVIADVHCNRLALQAVYMHLNGNVDAVWFLGDLFGRGDDFDFVYDYMCKIINPDIWLLGNHDMALLGDEDLYRNMNEYAKRKITTQKQYVSEEIKQYLKNLSAKKKVRKPFPILLSHAVPGKQKVDSVRLYERDVICESPLDENNRVLEIRDAVWRRARMWIIGHSHYQVAWRFHAGHWSQIVDGFGLGLDGKPAIQGLGESPERSFKLFFKELDRQDLIILNPGSVGFPKDALDGCHAKYMLLTLSKDSLECKFRSVRYEMKER